jgi:Protein of unknown function (DUF1554)
MCSTRFGRKQSTAPMEIIGCPIRLDLFGCCVMGPHNLPGRRNAILLSGGVAAACLLLSASCSGFWTGVGVASAESSTESSAVLALSSALLAGGLSDVNPALAPAPREFYFLYVTDQLVPGNFEDALPGVVNGNGLDEADGLCNSDPKRPDVSATYRALFSDGVRRIATTTANCDPACTGQNEWPLAANAEYRLANGTPILRTETGGIVRFDQGRTILNVLSGSTLNYWSGLHGDWTPSGHNCSTYTNPTNQSALGLASALSDQFIYDSGLGPSICNNLRPLLCVEVR